MLLFVPRSVNVFALVLEFDQEWALRELALYLYLVWRLGHDVGVVLSAAVFVVEAVDDIYELALEVCHPLKTLFLVDDALDEFGGFGAAVEVTFLVPEV